MSAAIISASISQVLTLVTLSGSSISSDRFSKHPIENRAVHHNSPTSASIAVHRMYLNITELLQKMCKHNSISTLKTLFPQKQPNNSITNSPSTIQLKLLHL
jgi:hypothetical protein